MSHALRRASPRRVWDRLAGFVDDRDLLRPVAVLAIMLVAAGAFVVLASIGEREPVAPSGSDPFSVQETLPSWVANRAGGYGFVLPETWDVDRRGRHTRVASPNGRVVLTFEPGSPGRLEDASARLLDSLLETQSDRELIGMTWQRIGGSRSLLVGGTAEQGRRPVRFLAITVRGQPRNYAITISVPAGSDPARMLPRLERLMTSFEILA